MISGRVLVTGGTGFVGGHLVRRLCGEGVGLRCLVRDRRRASAGGLPGETLMEGCLEDRASLERAAKGVDLVVHLAGAISALRAADYFRSNAEGTRNLLSAVLRSAPGATLVHVSSITAAGPSPDGEGTALPPDRCQPCSLYGESKRRGELAVVDSPGEFRWLILRPPLVYGPGDRATRLLFRQALAPLTPVPWTDRPLSLIHVRDLVQAIVQAGSCPSSRAILPLEGPDRLTIHALPRAIAAACGRRARLVPLPLFGVRGLALLADATARLRRRPGLFSRDKVREIAAAGWVADPNPARELLGFHPEIPTSQGLRDTARAEGFLGEKNGPGSPPPESPPPETPPPETSFPT